MSVESPYMHHSESSDWSTVLILERSEYGSHCLTAHIVVELWRTFCFGDHCRDNENESEYMKALRLWILKQRMLFLSRKHKRQWLTLLRH